LTENALRFLRDFDVDPQTIPHETIQNGTTLRGLAKYASWLALNPKSNGVGVVFDRDAGDFFDPGEYWREKNDRDGITRDWYPRAIFGLIACGLIGGFTGVRLMRQAGARLASQV
jgi:hypothetical protein